MTSEAEVCGRSAGSSPRTRRGPISTRLLARLYAAAPDAPLLAAIAAAPPLRRRTPIRAMPMARLAPGIRCARQARSPIRAAVAEEFQTLFVGVGKSEVSLYASHYLGPQSGRPLARDSRHARGLGARPPGGEQRVRRPPVGRARNHAHARRRRRRSASGADRRTARVLRAVLAAVGVRLLRCNIAVSSC